MPLDDFEYEDGSEVDWDSIDHIYLFIDEDGDVHVEAEDMDGYLIDFGDFSAEEAEDYIWDDLYYWAIENDIEIDKEISY